MPERATSGDRRGEKSAEAIVVTRKSDEGPNGEESGSTASLEGAMRQSDEAPTAGCGDKRSGTPVRRDTLRSVRDLNAPNRRMRTRMSGGVAVGIPYAD